MSVEAESALALGGVSRLAQVAALVLVLQRALNLSAWSAVILTNIIPMILLSPEGPKERHSEGATDNVIRAPSLTQGERDAVCEAVVNLVEVGL